MTQITLNSLRSRMHGVAAALFASDPEQSGIVMRRMRLICNQNWSVPRLEIALLYSRDESRFTASGKSGASWLRVERDDPLSEAEIMMFSRYFSRHMIRASGVMDSNDADMLYVDVWRHTISNHAQIEAVRLTQALYA